MKLLRIEVKNYKSFEDASVELSPFSVVVGANAAGKSNLIAAIRFLRDASLYGFSDAVSLQGGVKMMRHVYTDGPIVLSYDFSLDPYYGYGLGVNLNRNHNWDIKPTKLVYTVTIDTSDSKLKVGQVATIKYDFRNRESKKTEVIGKSSIEIASTSDKGMEIKRVGIPKGVKEKYKLEKDTIISYFSPILTSANRGFLRNDYFRERVNEEPIIYNNPAMLNIVNLAAFSFFDFDPHLAKQSSRFAGKKELDEDGNNFNVAMKYVLQDEGSKKKFLTLLSDFMPFITNFGISQVIDGSLVSQFSEKKDGDFQFPAYSMSDGTIYIACLILCVTFNKAPLIVLEEPEKYIHPSLALKVIEYLKNSAETKQIIVTSHSPQIIRFSGLDNIVVVSRKDAGSKLQRADEIPHIKKFLENDVGLDQVFSDNLLNF